MRRISLVGFLTVGLALLAAPAAFGQQSMGGGSTGGSGGGSGASSFGAAAAGGGFGTSSGGGFAGTGFGTSAGGGFAGGFASGSGGGNGTGFGAGTGGTGTGAGFGATGSTRVGSTSVFGKYYGNPYAAGMASAQTSSAASQYARPFPVALSFGNPVYTNTATVGRTGTGGLTGLGTGQNTSQQNRFQGASSAGMRRAPGYFAEPVFDVPARSRAEAAQPELQAVVSRSSRLPSAGGIRVSTDGETVVLSGRVTSERERRLAEAMIRLTPGVREVRNDLRPPGE